MNKKNQENNTKTVLIISHSEFGIKLSEQISKGEELLSRSIDREADFEELKADYKIWTDYNYELLKQSFNNISNEYVVAYKSAGYSFMGQLGEVPNNPVKTEKNLIEYKLENLKSLQSRANLIKSEKMEVTKSATQFSKNEVFIVHGHDEEAKIKTARFVEKLNLKAIILHEQVNAGKTIIEKIEEYSNVGFGLILYTPCDVGAKRDDETNLKPRARQNVVFEHGFLIGKIGRSNVCALVKGDIETPNDISGVVYVSMDSAGAWRYEVAKELKKAGYTIDMNLID